MSTRIHDGVLNEIVGKVGIIRMPIEGELQHSCPRHLELVAQRLDVGRNQPQILSDERQAAELR